jgi:hypothetical protein
METPHSEPEPLHDTVDFSPPPGVNIPLWRSLLSNLRDRFASEKAPPLQITAKPVDLGMLLGDAINLPWYRTVFTNVGDVITPETAPPLQLESQPVDLGELVSDQLQHGWWTSLLRSLADAAAPEKLPPLHLTAAPVNPEPASNQLLVPRWSALIPSAREAPTSELQPVFAQATSRTPAWTPTLGGTFAPPAIVAESGAVPELMGRARRTLHFAHLREAFWVSAAAAEVIFLAFWLFGRG